MMKNHGYEIEHNFCPGKRFPDLLTSAWHTALELMPP